MGRLTFVSIAITFILVEGVPMLAAWYKKQMEVKAREEGREEGRVEGRVAGRAENQKVWELWLEEVEAWEQRKADAERVGGTFNEPRPAPPSGEREAS